MPVSFITDVEGNWEYFCRFVGISEALSFADGSDGLGATGCMEVNLADGWTFVHGGDCADKGPGTIRFVTTLLALKFKYGDRVVLLLGNRDINKMRLSSELADAEIANLDTVGPYWVPEKSRVAPRDFLAKLAVAGRLPGSTLEPESPVTEKEIAALNTKANRCAPHAHARASPDTLLLAH
jgi:hypothetical protein